MTDHVNSRKLLAKGAVLIISLYLALVSPDLLRGFFTYSFGGLHTYHILWFGVMLVLAKRLFPRFNGKISSGKAFSRNYRFSGEDSTVKREKLQRLKGRVDAGALQSALYWTGVIIGTGLLHYLGAIPTLWLFVISLFFVFMDQFCITVWCPFQWLMKNKCCSTCRINNWGYFMAFSPLLFAPSVWTYSIIGLSIILIIQWEYLYKRYPERFSAVYNASLTCRNCTRKASCKA
jgi:hypothetical protein